MQQKQNNITHLLTSMRPSQKKIASLLMAVALALLPSYITAQVLTNENAHINVTEGTYVQGDTIDNLNGQITNQGLINLNGSFNNAANLLGNGRYNVAGNWRNTGNFNPGTSTVKLNGVAIQKIINTGFGYFYKLKINNTGTYPSGKIVLYDYLEVSNTLDMTSGIIETGSDTLFLLNQSPGSLIHNSGHIIGLFERGINAADNYLFPLGSSENYNPLNLSLNTVPSSGSVLSEFLPADPDTLGLPIPDTSITPGVEVYNVIKDGYWRLTANNTFSVANFDMNMAGTGFTDPNPVQDISRIIKRNIGGDWSIDGKHQDASGSVGFRINLTGNISSSGNEFAFGNVRPRILTQPLNDTVCDGTVATFSVVATGYEPLYYQWQQKLTNGGWQNLEDEGIYSGTKTATLTINTADLTMDGTEYRVRISHKHGHVNWSRWATLTVNPNPVALATPQKDTLCSGETTNIEITSDVPGSTYEWFVDNATATTINGAADGFGDLIQQTLTNPTDIADSVVYIIIPTGPAPTFCKDLGTPDTVVIYVNPIPRIEVTVMEDTLCDGGTSTITVTSPTVLTSGEVVYDFTIEGGSYAAGEVTGQSETFVESLGSIQQTLNNFTDEYQWVKYRIHPYTLGNTNGINCDFGTIRDTIFDIFVNPTPRVLITVDEDTICDNQTSNITVTSPTILTSGEVLFDLTVESQSGNTGDVTNQTDLLNNPLSTVSQTLSNNSDQFQYVEYRIHPKTNGLGPGTTCDYGQVQDSLFRVYVNPTPNISLKISNSLLTSDTTFCNNYDVLFEPHNDQNVIGTVKYHLVISGDDAIVNGETPTTDSVNIADFTNTLSHADTLIHQVNYQFIPYIENMRGTVGCYSGIDTTVVVKVLPELGAIESPLVLDPGGFNITCHGLSDGEILLDPEGGDYRYTYDIRWTDDPSDNVQDSISTRNSLPAGIYQYQVTDTIGCYYTESIQLTEPDTLEILLDSILQQNCIGYDPTGAIYINTSGGVPGYDYEWIHKLSEREYGTTEDLTIAVAGNYEIFFSDVFNCLVSKSYEIESAFELGSQVINKSAFTDYDVQCYGGSNAYVEVTAIGGAAPYDYRWYDDGLNFISDSSGIEELAAGTYYYSIEDANGCVLAEDEDSIVAVEITQPDPMHFNLIDDTYAGDWNISCNGANDGIIRFDYSGGHYDSIPYTYIWETVDGAGLIDSVPAQSDLSPGTYKLTVWDSGSQVDTINYPYYCMADTTVTLLEPPLIKFDYAVSEFIGGRNVSCFESADGYIHIDNITGGGPKVGSPEYSFEWIPPEGVSLPDNTVQYLENIPASGEDDYYHFTVSDQTGCAIKDSTRLFEPELLRADTTIDRDANKNGWAISCYSYADGEISLSTAGGTGPYSYAWTGPDGGFTGNNEVTGLSVGSYDVVISDANNCEAVYDFKLTSPDTIVLNPEPDFIECFGDTSTIYLSPEGGNLLDGNTYTYLWETGSVNQHLHAAQAGTYEVTVRDDNNCPIRQEITLKQNDRIKPVFDIPSDFNGTDISCYGAADGQITITATGGEPNYSYLWSTGATGSVINNVPAGDYFVTITDQFECEMIADTVLIGPREISLSIDASPPTCSYTDNGSIELISMFGNPYPASPSYIYSWTGPKENIQGTVLNDLPQGDYGLRVTDWNGCSVDTIIPLLAPNPIRVEYETVPVECIDANDGVFTITMLTGGSPPYEINDEFEQYEFGELSYGPYELVIRDNMQCVYSDTIEIGYVRISCLDIPNAFSPNGDGTNDIWVLDNDEDDSNDMYLYPDAELRIFNRWGELVYYTDDVANNPWDGRYRGRNLPIDTYHYILDLGNGDAPKKGNVTIITDDIDRGNNR